jgi:hypothetical protein
MIIYVNERMIRLNFRFFAFFFFFLKKNDRMIILNNYNYNYKDNFATKIRYYIAFQEFFY